MHHRKTKFKKPFYFLSICLHYYLEMGKRYIVREIQRVTVEHIQTIQSPSLWYHSKSPTNSIRARISDGGRHRNYDGRRRLRIIISPPDPKKPQNPQRHLPFSLPHILHVRHRLPPPMERIHHSRRLLLLPLPRRIR